MGLFGVLGDLFPDKSILIFLVELLELSIDFLEVLTDFLEVLPEFLEVLLSVKVFLSGDVSEVLESFSIREGLLLNTNSSNGIRGFFVTIVMS